MKLLISEMSQHQYSNKKELLVYDFEMMTEISIWEAIRANLVRRILQVPAWNCTSNSKPSESMEFLWTAKALNSKKQALRAYQSKWKWRRYPGCAKDCASLLRPQHWDASGWQKGHVAPMTSGKSRTPRLQMACAAWKRQSPFGDLPLILACKQHWWWQQAVVGMAKGLVAQEYAVNVLWFIIADLPNCTWSLWW